VRGSGVLLSPRIPPISLRWCWMLSNRFFGNPYTCPQREVISIEVWAWPAIPIASISFPDLSLSCFLAGQVEALVTAKADCCRFVLNRFKFETLAAHTQKKHTTQELRETTAATTTAEIIIFI